LLGGNGGLLGFTIGNLKYPKGLNGIDPPPPGSNGCSTKILSLLEILSFITNHYATNMQLIIICNYFDHVYNYKFDIV